jgi:hypothetical protein
MELYNKSVRSFILLKEKVLSGGRQCKDGTNNHKVWFDPETVIDVEAKEGARLVKMYPKQILDLKAKKPKAAKKAKEII